MSTYGFDPDAAPTSIVDYGSTRSGLSQLRRRWVPPDPRAVVLIVHGIAEHSGRYEHVGRQLCDAGLLTVGYDQRGFGETGGPRAFVESFDKYHDDVEDHMTELGALGLPIVLLGHSMGGLIATGYALGARPRPDLLVLSAPALGFMGPSFVRHVARAGAAIAPRFRVASPFPTSYISSDPRVVAHYEADPLLVRPTTLALAAAMAAAADDAGARLDSLDVRTLVLHGEADRLVPPTASTRFESLPIADRRTFAGLSHEIFNEPMGPEIIADTIDWIGTSLPGG